VNLKIALRSGAVLAAALCGIGASWAGTATGSFNVAVTLTSGCVARSTPTADLGAYTAFAAAKSANATVSFRCTRNLSGTPTITMTDTTGSVAGLAYTLSLGSTSATTAQSGDSGVTGTYDVYSATATATMTGPQAGDTSASSTATHNVTISF
jgi:hypothetical protein